MSKEDAEKLDKSKVLNKKMKDNMEQWRRHNQDKDFKKVVKEAVYKDDSIFYMPEDDRDRYSKDNTDKIYTEEKAKNDKITEYHRHTDDTLRVPQKGGFYTGGKKKQK